MTFSGNRMDGKICVITGATQELGAAIAHRLAAAGAAGIIVTGRNPARGEAVAHSLQASYGTKAHFIAADLDTVEDCRAATAQSARLFGRLDVLINAGALTDPGTILDTPPDLFDRMFAVNVRSPYFPTQDAIKLMIRDGSRGAICNIGSISALAGRPLINAYCASKGALTTLTTNTAFSVIANRIRVNQLNIGWMSSDHERALKSATGGADREQEAAAKLPFGRLVEPAEAARAVNFLVSDDAGPMTQ
ncbi:MAG: oxidoreductase [Cypionkella sp.]